MGMVVPLHAAGVGRRRRHGRRGVPLTLRYLGERGGGRSGGRSETPGGGGGGQVGGLRHLGRRGTVRWEV